MNVSGKSQWLSTLRVPAVAVLVCCIPPILMLCSILSESFYVSHRSKSPDGRYEVVIYEKVIFIDRNFDLRLIDHTEQTKRVIFSSPDEGRPIGTEQIEWSTDGTYFLLTGEEFYLQEEDEILMEDKRQAYILFHLPSDQLWCASSAISYYYGQNTNPKPSKLTPAVLDEHWRQDFDNEEL